MKVLIPALFLSIALIGCKKQHAPVSETHHGAVTAHWGYEGKDGPEYWPRLSPAYAACSQGREQSPINIVQTASGDQGAWKLDYKQTSLKIAHHEHVIDIVDNGHTIQVTVDEGSTLATGRSVYRLKQFHFHTPSEHTIDGSHFPLEVHFVHQDEQGRFAVLAALYQEGPANENLAKIIAHFPKAKGQSAEIPEVSLDLNFHMPATNASYTYLGSLTTPPCTEGVEWLVFRDPISASKDQLEAFARVLGTTNRPVQPLNGRIIGRRSTEGQIKP